MVGRHSLLVVGGGGLGGDVLERPVRGNRRRPDLPLVVDVLLGVLGGRLGGLGRVRLLRDAQHAVHVDAGQAGVRGLVVGERTL